MGRIGEALVAQCLLGLTVELLDRAADILGAGDPQGGGAAAAVLEEFGGELERNGGHGYL